MRYGVFVPNLDVFGDGDVLLEQRRFDGPSPVRTLRDRTSPAHRACGGPGRRHGPQQPQRGLQMRPSLMMMPWKLTSDAEPPGR